MTSGVIANLQKLIGTPRDGALLRFSLGNEYLKSGDAHSAQLQLAEAVAAAAGASLDHAAKLTIYLTDLAHFAKVNEAMAAYFTQPYPARAAVGVASLPRGALIEADAIRVIQ